MIEQVLPTRCLQQPLVPDLFTRKSLDELNEVLVAITLFLVSARTTWLLARGFLRNRQLYLLQQTLQHGRLAIGAIGSAS